MNAQASVNISSGNGIFDCITIRKCLNIQKDTNTQILGFFSVQDGTIANLKTNTISEATPGHGVIIMDNLILSNSITFAGPTPNAGEVLTFNGTNWLPSPIMSGSDIVLDSNASPKYPTNLSKGLWYGLNTKANSFDSSTITLGNNARTFASNSIAIGVQTLANGVGDVSIGYNAICGGDELSGTYSVAIGYSPTCFGPNSICIGKQSTSREDNAICIGNNSFSFPQSVTIGSGSSAQGIAIGSNSTSSCIAIGNNSLATASSIAIGVSSSASQAYSLVAGNNASSSANYCVVLGQNASTHNFGQSVAIGSQANVYAQNSFAGGKDTLVQSGADNSVVIGYNSVANVPNSLALGAGAVTNTVLSGSAGLAINIPSDTITDYTPGIPTKKMYLMINGIRYSLSLTPEP